MQSPATNIKMLVMTQYGGIAWRLYDTTIYNEYTRTNC